MIAMAMLGPSGATRGRWALADETARGRALRAGVDWSRYGNGRAPVGWEPESGWRPRKDDQIRRLPRPAL